MHFPLNAYYSVEREREMAIGPGKSGHFAGTGVGMTWPVSAFITAITLLRHPRNRRGWRASMAMLLGDSQGAVSIAAQP
jgi:hypothetical protein